MWQLLWKTLQIPFNICSTLPDIYYTNNCWSRSNQCQAYASKAKFIYLFFFIHSSFVYLVGGRKDFSSLLCYTKLYFSSSPPLLRLYLDWCYLLQFRCFYQCESERSTVPPSQHWYWSARSDDSSGVSCSLRDIWRVLFQIAVSILNKCNDEK